ncbi:hypothetical protein [Sphingobium sp. AS12]|uniref:hypothetical protein n=1 Tax=Sphingobium sp. AS12 TaxID=2849495 RepID=UPI0020C86786|nr:hypothetical protein [Sphingobium sp. AS12]
MRNLHTDFLSNEWSLRPPICGRLYRYKHLNEREFHERKYSVSIFRHPSGDNYKWPSKPPFFAAVGTRSGWSALEKLKSAAERPIRVDSVENPALRRLRSPDSLALSLGDKLMMGDRAVMQETLF